MTYSVLRILAFLVPFGIMMLFPLLREWYWLSAVFAALIGMSLSIIFLRRPLDAATERMAARASKKRSGEEQDADAEDAALDAE